MTSEKLLLLIYDLVNCRYPKILRSLISIEFQNISVTLSNSITGHYLNLDMNSENNLIIINNCSLGVKMTENHLTGQIKKLLFL